LTSPRPHTSPSPSSASADLVVELWLDIGCPWCYLGRHRLEQAIGATVPEGGVELVLRSFELNPGMPAAMPVPEYLAEKFAGTVERALAADGRVAELARADGLPYTSQRLIADSFDVHRVLHLARTHGVATVMFRELQRGYFGGELNPFDPRTLVRVAEEAGVPAGETESVLSGDGYADSVREETTNASNLGITGVPFTVLGGVYAVAGAQSVEVYAEAIQKALAVEQGAPLTDGA